MNVYTYVWIAIKANNGNEWKMNVYKAFKLIDACLYCAIVRLCALIIHLFIHDCMLWS